MRVLSLQQTSKVSASIFVLLSGLCTISSAQIGIWSSSKELAGIPASGPAWDAVVAAADAADPNDATVSNQNSNNNVEILAAAITYARTGAQSYKFKVESALKKLVLAGHPGDRTLAWARETGAYVMAADLVGYRTAAFEAWCRNVAEVWQASDGRTLMDMFKKRPNNWGAMAFGSLAAIYAYLGDSARLNEIRNHWVSLVVGPKPATASYGKNLSWHADVNKPRLINPAGATKLGMNIDGVIADDLRRGGSFAEPPGSSGYPWEHLQGAVTAARILQRAGLSIWEVGDNAIYRAAYALQVRFEQRYGGWAAAGDDEWLLPFLDEAYGTIWTTSYDQVSSRIWKAGKIAGWAYVALNRDHSRKGPNAPDSLVVRALTEDRIEVTWRDNASDEWGFGLQRSLDGGATFSDLDLVPANTTSYSDRNLSAATAYCYRVRTRSPSGNSGYSVVACATTADAGPIGDAVAYSEVSVSGDVAGSYEDTHASDNHYQILQERSSPAGAWGAFSYLEHKWLFDIRGGTSNTIYVEAWRSANSEDDDFIFSYSSDDKTYHFMMRVSKNGDDDSYQSYALPATLAGTLYIRVVDSDRTERNSTNDFLYVDHLFVRSWSGPDRQITVRRTGREAARGSSEIAELVAADREQSAGRFPQTLRDEPGATLPATLQLSQNYPNPFNPATVISFQLPQPGDVHLVVFNLLGQVVRTLASQNYPAGLHQVRWDGTDQFGNQVASGIYYYRLAAAGMTRARKMKLLR